MLCQLRRSAEQIINAEFKLDCNSLVREAERQINEQLGTFTSVFKCFLAKQRQFKLIKEDALNCVQSFVNQLTSLSPQNDEEEDDFELRC